MVRVATIDCGSNTFRLQVWEHGPHGLYEIGRLIRSVRLGTCVADGSKCINRASLRRAMACLSDFKATSIALQVQDIICVGTSILRTAYNSSYFQDMVKEQLGITVDVLSGQEEALLSFKGATQIVNKGGNEATVGGAMGGAICGAECIGVLDIGGGSTELVYSSSQGLQAYSVDLGVVRLTKALIHSDPATHQEIWALERHIKKLWQVRPRMAVDVVVGVGGTITTLAAMYHKMKNYCPHTITGTTLSREYIALTSAKLTSMTIQQRQHIAGLMTERADIIIAGIIILETIMDIHRWSSIVVNDYDLLYGLALEYFSKF